MEMSLSNTNYHPLNDKNMSNTFRITPTVLQTEKSILDKTFKCSDINLFKKNMIKFLKYFLFFECCVNASTNIISVILLSNNNNDDNNNLIFTYGTILLVCYYIRILLLSSTLVKIPNTLLSNQNLNNNVHLRNINISIYFIVSMAILLAYGSYLTQNKTIHKYYFSKAININILFAEILKVIGLMCSTTTEDFGGYDGYTWFVSL